MRIAVSGAHGTGKTTLVAELAALLRGHRVVEEPYHAMVAEGYAFPDPPGRDDYVAQLERSIVSLEDAEDAEEYDVVFDRCPADFLAYLAALPGADPDSLRAALDAAQPALGSLDLVVYVPIESPDPIAAHGIGQRKLRRDVDALLHDMLIDDGWALGLIVLRVSGTAAERARQVAVEIGVAQGAS